MKSEPPVSPVEAKPSGTVIVVRDADAGIEVLLLQRNPELRHMPGFWVFPGGKVDPEDPGDSPLEKARAAAAREVEEESGLRLAVDCLTTFSHWLTPVEMPRRFATWFYLVDIDEDASGAVRADGREMVAHRWATPAVLESEFLAGRIQMPPPTLVSLRDIGRHGSVASLKADVARREPPFFFPKLQKHPEGMLFLYPGDAGYENGDSSTGGGRHRMVMGKGVLRYERDFEWPDRAAVSR